MARGRTYRRKRSDGSWGRWHAVIDAPTSADGRRRQVTKTFDSRRLAHAWLAEQSAGFAGYAESDSGLLVRDWLVQWLDELPYVRVSTRTTYRTHIERYLVPALGDVALDRLTVDQVSALVADLHRRGLAPATIKRIMATLHAALSVAVRSGHVSVNPARGVRLPPVMARPHTVWNARQCAAFLAGCSDDGLGVLFRLALVTGMRRGELLGLTWSNIDLSAGLVVVRSTRIAVGGDVITSPPKTRHGVRQIYLDPATIRALAVVRASQPRSIGTQDAWVFTHASGEPFVPGWVSRAFDRRIADLGLPRIRFHDLRHTSATLGLASGESLKEISMRLGHADIAITANVYSDILPETASASARRRAQFMSQTDTAQARQAQRAQRARQVAS